MIHVLVVDDSEIDRKLVGGLLERHGRFHAEYASSGLEALEHLEESVPLAVVTDLLMPDMDGLELVEAMRKRYANIPVILITASGSEDVALKALLAGAADYVPKARLASDLETAVQKVLAASGGGSHERIVPFLRHYEVRYELENEPSLIPPLVAEIQEAAGEIGIIGRADRVRLAKAVSEALENAIVHGNLEISTQELEAAAGPEGRASLLGERRGQAPFRDRRALVRAEMTPEEVRVTIRDEGPGFDVQSLASPEPLSERMSSNRGRGMVLIRAFMDEVQFNHAGNEITLVKKRKA